MACAEARPTSTKFASKRLVRSTRGREGCCRASAARRAAGRVPGAARRPRTRGRAPARSRFRKRGDGGARARRRRVRRAARPRFWRCSGETGPGTPAFSEKGEKERIAGKSAMSLHDFTAASTCGTSSRAQSFRAAPRRRSRFTRRARARWITCGSRCGATTETPSTRACADSRAACARRRSRPEGGVRLENDEETRRARRER